MEHIGHTQFYLDAFSSFFAETLPGGSFMLYEEIREDVGVCLPSEASRLLLLQLPQLHLALLLPKASYKQIHAQTQASVSL